MPNRYTYSKTHIFPGKRENLSSISGFLQSGRTRNMNIDIHGNDISESHLDLREVFHTSGSVGTASLGHSDSTFSKSC